MIAKLAFGLKFLDKFITALYRFLVVTKAVLMTVLLAGLIVISTSGPVISKLSLLNIQMVVICLTL